MNLPGLCKLADEAPLEILIDKMKKYELTAGKLCKFITD